MKVLNQFNRVVPYLMVSFADFKEEALLLVIPPLRKEDLSLLA